MAGRSIRSRPTSTSSGSITRCAGCSSAPRASTDVGAEVRVLSSLEGAPVVLEQENLLVASFHPELIDETGLHRYLLTKI